MGLDSTDTPPPDPTDTPPPDPTRDRLVRAGIQVLDELPLAKVLAGATTARVAEQAGVTTGSFFHHFANSAEFADQVALSLRQQPQDLAEQVDEMVDSLEHADLVEVMRANLGHTWEVFSSDEGIRQLLRLQLGLWAHHHQPLSHEVDGLRTVGDVLRDNYRVRHDDAVAGWRHLMSSTGRSFVEPFDLDRIAVALTALFEGLLIRQQVAPDEVDAHLFADVSTALASALTVAEGRRVTLADRLSTLGVTEPVSPQARSGARRRRATRDRIVAAATGMFGDGWEAVPATDVAEVAGVSNQTVVNLFRTVRAVAAATFGRHMDDLRAAQVVHADRAPEVSLHRVLTRLAELVQADRGPARALLEERLVTIGRDEPPADDDVRAEVPIMEALIEPLGAMDLGDLSPLEAGTTLINVTITLALDRVNRPGYVASLAMRMLPAGGVAAGRQD